MSNELLINVTPSESRVALVENGLLQELHLERTDDISYVGNIYLGRVERVLPGMQAAFVNIGLDRTAFLHASEIARPRSELEEVVQGSRKPELDVRALIERANEPPLPLITDLLHQGQELLVQVIKDPLGSKGARLTTQLSLPSRYLVYLPTDEATIGISLRIEDETERERLRDLVLPILSPDQPAGIIVRTNAEGIGADELVRDLDYLRRLWARIGKRMQDQPKPGDCVYEELSLPLRAIRDWMNAGIDRVRIDDAATLARARDFTASIIQEWSDRIEAYNGIGPLFDLFGVEDEIERALKRNVPLKSGGYLTIDQTEAMTTIDVNTGAYVGVRNFSETIFKTNLEAAQALARQLRLRNLGGIIIIDFIDMDDEGHKSQVLRTLNQALARDPARTNVLEISALGLVEMTRKRTTESLGHRLCEPCPDCSGRGWQKSVETICSEIFREILRAVRQFETGQLRVLAATPVVEKILEEHTRTIAELTEQLGTEIRFQPEDQYSQEQFDVVLL
ncbi:MAG: ribonuclease G [Pseudomonadota bacterium]